MTPFDNLVNDLPVLPRRERDSHKGHYGRVLIIGGSRGMAGAAGLAGMAALRGGAGLVTVATADCCLETVASYDPSYMTSPLPCDAAGRIDATAKSVIAELAESKTCIACGPGLGRSDGLSELVAWLYQTVELPMVFDADALNALAGRPDVLRSPGGPRLLTPHPGEFRRLAGQDASSPEEQADQAERFAREWGIVLLLKGNRSVVTDGKSRWVNRTGNPGMATGGTGDVLTGLLVALLAQQLVPLAAARLGAHLHGLAGDLAAMELGEVSLTARDLIRFFPHAIRDFSR